MMPDRDPGLAPPRPWHAPGRVNLIGDHTDHQEGWCLPLAIDRACRVTPTPGPPGTITARSDDLPGPVTVAADGSTEPAGVDPSWGRFVAAAVREVTDRGGCPPGLDLAIRSTVPTGAGLSSSAALAVALVGALADVVGLTLGPLDLARAARRAEITATGVPCGMMDQVAATAAVAGHALLLDCRDLGVTPIAIPRPVGFVVVHSGRHRALATSGYADRVTACAAAASRLGLASLRDATLADVADDPPARHVVTENARVLAFADALRAGDLDACGAAMTASHASLRDDFGVSCPELDDTVEWLLAAGAHGARLTGAGFGGCVVAVVTRDHADAVVARTVRAAERATGVAPLAFVVRSAGPAGPLAT